MEPTAGASPRPTALRHTGTARQGCRALQGRTHPTPVASRGSIREGASKRVARTALWFCRTVATGGRKAMRQRPPRAGTFVPDPRIKLSRKWGSGGGHHWRPIRADVATPGDLFAPFGSLQKGLAARWRRNIPQSKSVVQNRREGASPRPTWLHHTGTARPVVAPHANGLCCLPSRAPAGRPGGCPVASRGRWPSHPYDVPHPKLHIPIHLLEIVPHHALLVSIKKLLTLARSGIYTKNRQLYD